MKGCYFPYHKLIHQFKSNEKLSNVKLAFLVAISSNFNSIEHVVVTMVSSLIRSYEY